jgi:hypothetical protein
VPGAHHRAGDRQEHLRAFFADIVGVTVKLGPGHFAQVQVNESLILDFADAPEPWGGPGSNTTMTASPCSASGSGR